MDPSTSIFSYVFYSDIQNDLQIVGNHWITGNTKELIINQKRNNDGLDCGRLRRITNDELEKFRLNSVIQDVPSQACVPL